MKPKAVDIPLEQLDSVASLVQKDEDAALEHVFVEFVTDNGEKAVMRLAEVDWLAAKEDLRRPGKSQH